MANGERRTVNGERGKFTTGVQRAQKIAANLGLA